MATCGADAGPCISATSAAATAAAFAIHCNRREEEQWQPVAVYGFGDSGEKITKYQPWNVSRYHFVIINVTLYDDSNM